MSVIKKDKLFLVKKLYNDGLSAREIADELNESIHAVYYFFRKYKIKRRNRIEARNISYKRQDPSFLIKKKLSVPEIELKISGVMLYWGEGSKWEGERIVDFANSNPEMIKVFLNFLRKICGVQEEKLRIYLYCYSNQNPSELIRYWSKITNIPKKQFTKPYVRKDYKEDKAGKMKYGLVHVRYADKKLLDTIRAWIDEYINKFI